MCAIKHLQARLKGGSKVLLKGGLNCLKGGLKLLKGGLKMA